ncbi:MAG: phenylacetate-CoA oxygenase subunit PaaJ, partial [Acidobacteriaceae bacterium]|nr:phenylacetate-CoA oxygenase subunit PaaJ [Acidobacteriaceae bacterium]
MDAARRQARRAYRESRLHLGRNAVSAARLPRSAMVAVQPSIAEIWSWMSEIPDPEIPVLSIVDLGIVRDVRWTEENELIVAITPTYSGCPAMDVIASDIRSSLKNHGISAFRLETKLSPAWTTDWMSDNAKERLREYGIAPAERLIPITGIAPLKSSEKEQRVQCPRCGSEATTVISRYGSTPCKALYRCSACLEPFDVFKQ